MNQHPKINKLADRKTNKARKRENKKREIAESAIEALKLFGYARTTLRDIAAQSDMPLSSLHYYFEDKDELLIYCVRQYKADFLEEIGTAIASIRNPKDITQAFCRALAETISNDAEVHRLWYDIRNQAMFDDTFVPIVTELETQLTEMMEPIAANVDAQKRLYLRFDGVFRSLLQDHLNGAERPVDEMQRIFFEYAI